MRPSLPWPPIHASTSDADGRFIIKPIKPGDRLSDYVIAATFNGFGPGFARASGESVELKLAADDVWIEGRILDLQGKPVAGATVRPNVLYRSDAANIDVWERTGGGTSTKEARRRVRHILSAFHSFRRRRHRRNREGRENGYGGPVQNYRAWARPAHHLPRFRAASGDGRIPGGNAQNARDQDPADLLWGEV